MVGLSGFLLVYFPTKCIHCKRIFRARRLILCLFLRLLEWQFIKSTHLYILLILLLDAF